MSATKILKTELQKETIITFRVIRGGLYSHSIREKRVNDFWTFCHSTFWSNELFTEEEQQEFKMLIADHFKDGKDADEVFFQLLQRATLAKRYIKRRSTRYISKPSDWLNINFKKGLAGTENWLKEVEDQRLTVPTYNEGIELLAEAILSWTKKGNADDVMNYREKFIVSKQFDLLFLYTNAIMHFQYINI
jgi:hypothetical protein